MNTIAATHRFTINKPMASMYAQCSTSAECTSEYLFGEAVLCIDESGNSLDLSIPSESNPSTNPETKLQANSKTASENLTAWVRVQAARDDYTGYMQRADLQAAPIDLWQSTHWVAQRSTLVFAEPSIKSPVLCRLPFLSRVCAEPQQHDSFLALRISGYIWAEHLLPSDKVIDQPALQLAQTHFLGAPYLWGGCSPNGVDCSGLIQALAVAKGIKLPRDSGDQERFLEHSITRQERQIGDLVYWPGHVGILADKETLLHATAYSLSCTLEPLADVEKRAGGLSSIKRLFS